MMVRRIESLLQQLRGAFRRQATFEWFVIVVFAFMVRVDVLGVSSIVRCFAFASNEYHNLLWFFHTSAFSIRELCQRWAQLVSEQTPKLTIRGMAVHVIDSILVGKAGQKMPGVKKLHQESDNNTKPEYIMGHFWGALSILAHAGDNAFALPLRMQLQDGLKRSPSERSTRLDKMAELVTSTLRAGSLMVADAYYCSQGFIRSMCDAGIVFVTKCRFNAVGYLTPPPRPQGKRGPKPKKGPRVKLQRLFEQKERFLPAGIELLSKQYLVWFRCVDLLWQGLPVRFVLTIFPDGTRSILLCSHRNLSPIEIIGAYCLRFKIEVSFKALVHLLGGFAYHFWLMEMPKVSWTSGNQYLHRATARYREMVWRKVEAYERFVNLAGIALGILQLLAIEYPRYVWHRFPVWFRTLPEHGCPSEQVVRLTLQWELVNQLSKSSDSALIQEFLSKRNTEERPAHPYKMAA